MRIDPFRSERLLSTWQNHVRFDFTETGVHPLFLRELLTRDELDELYESVQLRYIQTDGTPALKAAICAAYDDLRPEQVLVTNGSAEANFLALWRLVDPGDEVVAILPTYMQAPGIAAGFGAAIRPVFLDPARGWALDRDGLRAAVSPRTKLIYVVNPNNPTGAVLSRDEMAAIVEAATSVDAWILADEVYRGAELDGEETPTFWGSAPKALVVAGLSKAYTLPGLRLGWLLGPPDVIADAWGRHDYTTITRGALSDPLAVLAMRPETRARILARNREISSRNLTVLTGWLDRHRDLFHWVPPKIGGVAFVGYAPDVNATDLVMRLLEEHSVLVVPGDTFGIDRWLRIGYGSPTLGEGLDLVGQTMRALAAGEAAAPLGR